MKKKLSMRTLDDQNRGVAVMNAIITGAADKSAFQGPHVTCSQHQHSLLPASMAQIGLFVDHINNRIPHLLALHHDDIAADAGTRGLDLLHVRIAMLLVDLFGMIVDLGHEGGSLLGVVVAQLDGRLDNGDERDAIGGWLDDIASGPLQSVLAELAFVDC